MSLIDEFFDGYFLLNAEESSCSDFFRFLFSEDVKYREAIECRDEQDDFDGFRRRWMIFISVLAQKFFFTARYNMASVGSKVEIWLNLVPSNGGFRRTVLNLMKGHPDIAYNLLRKGFVAREKSADFISLVGNLDKRVDLDEKIKPDNRKYASYLSMMASKLSYENGARVETIVKDRWKMEFLGFYNFWNDFLESNSTPAFMFRDTRPERNLIVVAFRGTDPFDADGYRTDVEISWYQLQGIGKIHRGFMRALGLQKNKGWPKNIDHLGQPFFAYYTLREELKKLLQENEGAKFVVTGHSLGGALAILMVAVLVWHEEAWLLDKLEGVYTFGQPRVGDEEFGEYMKEKLEFYDVKYLRYVYCNDVMARLPYDDKALLFKHFGPCLYFSSCYKGQVLEEEPNKNYFSFWWIIPNHLTACWEVLRGFILPLIKGRKFKETWCMKLYRLVGLIIPGLPVHCPYEYVNVTMLGSLQPDPAREQNRKYE